MKMKLSVVMLMLAATPMFATQPNVPAISGDYLEVRSCDVYTGPCFANAEMGLSGREGMLVWSVREGAWKGVKLDGLNVIAVVRTDGTLGDLRYQPRSGKAVLVVDAAATRKQRDALVDFARAMAGGLIQEVAGVKTAPMQVALGTCDGRGCASVKAGDLVQITTRCLGSKDHLCGNEETFYPPLTRVTGAYPVFTELASFDGRGLNLTWAMVEKRNAFLGHFER
ncbi:MAG TPA: DUF1326 domain-containing protein [Candidatus Angelobacter sp.]|nr:DUF1326 domain-containing protein [Candidatus Angelobacter sp.]